MHLKIIYCNLYLKITSADFEKLTAHVEAFATVKKKICIGESLVSSNANIELHYKLKANQEHGKCNRAITTAADAALWPNTQTSLL